MDLGSEEMATINQLAAMTISIAGKKMTIRHVPGPTGVRGRNSDNRLIRARLGCAPGKPLRDVLAKTFQWIDAQVRAASEVATAASVAR